MKHFVIFITIICLSSCKEEKSMLSRVKSSQLQISDSITPVDSLMAFIKPYRNRIDEVLDSTLAYAPKTITKEDGKYNTSAGNLMADIVLDMANPIFRSRTKKNIDFVVLNHGGIRSVISKGNVTARTAYEVMPFENNIVVVGLNGKSVRELVSFLVKSDRPHPIAGMQILVDEDQGLQSVNIKGMPFDENRTYYVATSDYLLSGGDDMGFFKTAMDTVGTDYLIRNAIIDYFKKMDTIAPVVDNRFKQLNRP
ncbi:MAG: 5'-nucleotidase C-terminal domain-containing protein [Bacteroidota bacterium]